MTGHVGGARRSSAERNPPRQPAERSSARRALTAGSLSGIAGRRLDAVAPSLGLVLLGLSTATLALGCIWASPSPSGHVAAPVAGILVAGAIGLWLPRALASRLWAAGAASRGDAPAPGPLALSTVADQPSFSWMQIACLAMFLGLLAAFMPLGAAAFRRLYAVFDQGFLWTAASREVLDFLWALSLGLWPMLAAGAVLLCIEHLEGAGAWSPRSLSSWMFGAALAGPLTAYWAWLQPADLLQRAAAVPALALSCLAAYRSWRLEPVRTAAPCDALSAPEERAASGWTARMVIAGLTVAAVFVVLPWPELVQSADPERATTGAAMLTGTLLACAALGARLAGASSKMRVMHPPLSPCVIAGAVLAAGAVTVFHALGPQNLRLGRGLAAAVWLIAGYLWGRCLQTGLRQTTDPGRLGVEHVVLTLLSAAGLLLARPWASSDMQDALPALGPTLLAVIGAMLPVSPRTTRASRHIPRLAVVLASLAVVAVILPSVTRRILDSRGRFSVPGRQAALAP